MFTRRSSALAAQVLCTAAFATVVATATPASAQTAVACSESALSTAITNANSSGGDTLRLAPGCTYALTTPLPAITSDIVIEGRHSTITRASAASFGILTVDEAGSLIICDVTITNGDAPDFGGGIANYGQLTVRNSVVRDNHANFSGGIGGFAGTTTQIENTSIFGNTANVNGGGVANDGDMTIVNSRVIGNTANTGVGGGAANDGTLQILRSNVNGNDAPRAGGVANIGGGSTTITNSNVNNNTASVAPGGVLNTGGSVALNFSRVRNNQPTNCAGSDIPIPNCTG
ncbi:hypothetical protein ABZT08_01785 [Streptomyces sp. NPDC005526]|uniref:hypothetical protein n=1 Tax=Streptomyces sp. NPDC005526 TaxID=3156885 RepID=UPI00339E7BCF